MTNAWFSGSVQQALLIDGATFLLLMGNDSQTARRITATEAAIISEDWSDAYLRTVDSEADAREELRRAGWCYDALLASSLAIDAQVNDSRRQQAAIEAERLLREDFASNYVLNAYSARPMPESADLSSAHRLCDKKNLEKLGEIVQTVQIFQENIRATRDAWEQIDIQIFGGLKERALFQAEAVRSGLFLSLVKRIVDIKRHEGFLEMLNKPSIAELPSSKEVLSEWLSEAKRYAVNAVALTPAFHVAPMPRAPSFTLLAQGRAAAAHAGVERVARAFVLNG